MVKITKYLILYIIIIIEKKLFIYIFNYFFKKKKKKKYFPKCKPSCNMGTCINNNVCNCTGTHLIGQYCNEFKKLERIYGFDVVIKILSFLLIATSIIIMEAIYFFRKNPILKAGKVY